MVITLYIFMWVEWPWPSVKAIGEWGSNNFRTSFLAKVSISFHDIGLLSGIVDGMNLILILFDLSHIQGIEL